MMIYLLQSSFCLALFYLVYMAFFKAHTYHRFSRYYLLSTLFLSLLIPWIEITTSIQTLVISSTSSNIMQNAEIVEKSIFTLPNILLSLYLIGVAVSLFLFLSKLFKLIVIIMKGEKQMIDGYNIVYVNKEIGTCSFFKYIIFSKENQGDLNHIELTHEKSHVSQFHSIDIILAWIYQSFFWFNPIAYLYKIRLLEVHEFLADQDAIKQIDKSSYQDYILGVVCQTIQPQLVNNFKSIIKTRLIMMNSKSQPSKWSYLAILTVFSFAIFFFSCQTKKAVKKGMFPVKNSKWLSETVIDTTYILDSNTFDELVTIQKAYLQYRLDTVVTIDPVTNEETQTIKKTYSDLSKDYLENRFKK